MAATDRLRAAFDAHFDFVWRFLRRLGAPSGVADDLAQEVYLVLSRRLDEVHPGKERSFLFGTAVRLAAEERRLRQRRGWADADALEDVVDPAPGPETQLDESRAREKLDAILAAMPEELRIVFVLFELEEMTMSDIANLLEVPAGTVASRLRRAREDFERRAARVRRTR